MKTTMSKAPIENYYAGMSVSNDRVDAIVSFVHDDGKVSLYISNGDWDGVYDPKEGTIYVCGTGETHDCNPFQEVLTVDLGKGETYDIPY